MDEEPTAEDMLEFLFLTKASLTACKYRGGVFSPGWCCEIDGEVSTYGRRPETAIKRAMRAMDG